MERLFLCKNNGEWILQSLKTNKKGEIIDKWQPNEWIDVKFTAEWDNKIDKLAELLTTN